MLDINGSEFLIIALLAVILVGPERLPEYVRGLRALVKRAREAVHEGQQALSSEFGEDVDWTTLDPRQYDPRRIVREALFDDDRPATAPVRAGDAAATVPRPVSPAAAAGSPAASSDATPYDDEAT